ncbi:MAG: hypothetical protein ACXABK_04770 [Candidatus Heimdallarchaeaceae archaeon]
MLDHRNGEQRILRDLDSPIRDTLNYVAANADTVIHGDLKVHLKGSKIMDFGSNVVDGKLVDYGRVRWGRIAEDLARAFVSADLTDKQIYHYTGKYIEHRCKHDQKFAADIRKQGQIYKDMPHLVREERIKYASVLRRRVGIVHPDELLATANKLVGDAYRGFKADREKLKILTA